MTHTLTLGEKITLTVSPTLTIDTIRQDMIAGNIKHDPATKIGRSVIAYDNGDGTIILASAIRGDMDASGGINQDDFDQRACIKVACADGFLLLDENNYIFNALAP